MRQLTDGFGLPLIHFNPRTPCGVRQGADGRWTGGRHFNPRTPCGVRQGGRLAAHADVAFQSTHPLRGATRRKGYRDSADAISIHAPLAGCDRPCLNTLKVESISIHAPLAGCDAATVRPGSAPSTFQSTHPLRGATMQQVVSPPSAQFQSTHPLRGATSAPTITHSAQPFQSTHPLRGATRRVYDANGQDYISIHAPLAGCDLTSAARRPWGMHFNPRTPCGVRLCIRSYPQKSAQFQSTHPLRGATERAKLRSKTYPDFNPRTPCGVRRVPLHGRSAAENHFNPRTPCGVRRRARAYPCAGGYFNPRTPCGVRPRCWKPSAAARRFQSTHPLRGATSTTPKMIAYVTEFQSTHPLRGATSPSVHRPLCFLFQSTHPLRGATIRTRSPLYLLMISIHAPLAGCDTSFILYI